MRKFGIMCTEVGTTPNPRAACAGWGPATLITGQYGRHRGHGFLQNHSRDGHVERRRSGHAWTECQLQLGEFQEPDELVGKCDLQRGILVFGELRRPGAGHSAVVDRGFSVDDAHGAGHRPLLQHDRQQRAHPVVRAAVAQGGRARARQDDGDGHRGRGHHV